MMRSFHFHIKFRALLLQEMVTRDMHTPGPDARRGQGFLSAHGTGCVCQKPGELPLSGPGTDFLQGASRGRLSRGERRIPLRSPALVPGTILTCPWGNGGPVSRGQSC